MTPSERFPVLPHGGDYNPDQWPDAVWDDDVRLMRLAHVNIATLPVFGWARLQPDEETFDFGWLDAVLEKLTAGGIYLCLATATALTPAWLDAKYPDVLRVNKDGVKLKHGNRHSFCPNSANYRRLATGLAGQLAGRYGKHPKLLVWHVNNEYGNVCYCDRCAVAFRAWLQGRYGSLDELNARWYTAFWGHTYSDWAQIETPTTNGERSIQAILVDYDRFQSESLLRCFTAERDVLRAASPGIPVTTNLMGAYKPLDYHRWAREMDIVSWDSYPAVDQRPAQIAFGHSLMRGLKAGEPFLLMEQTPSQQNWQPQNALKRPGVLRLWSLQAVAHGADSVMYFQWRRGRGGTEKYHGAVVEHAGTPDARVFREVAELGADLERLGRRTLGGRTPARAAILFDWNGWWAAEYSSGPTVDLKYIEQCSSWFEALHGLNVAIDIVAVDADLSGYSLVVAPVLYMLRPGVAERLESWTAAGGTFVTTFFSGMVDETDRVFPGGYPGPLRKLCGVWAEEIDALRPGQRNSVEFTPGALVQGRYACKMLCDRIHPEGAQVLATYGSDFYAGEAAITMNAFGAGRACYVATALEADGLATLCAALCRQSGVVPVIAGAPSDVEVTERTTPDGERLIFLLNHAAEARRVALPVGRMTDLLSGASVDGTAELSPRGVMVLAR